MSRKQTVLVAAILLSVILVVGLILCRPMGPERYASGIFNFAAVSNAAVSAEIFDPTGARAEALILTGDDAALKRLTELFDGKGFGMTPAGLFSDKLPDPTEGDICWSVTFSCTISDSTLTAEYVGGKLRLTGDSATVVTTQDLDGWARKVYDVIESLYPEPTEEDGVPGA